MQSVSEWFSKETNRIKNGNFSKIKLAILVVMIVIVAFLTLGCNIEETARDRSSAIQEKNISKAQNAVPIPNLTHYQTRETSRKWLLRMDRTEATYYVYVLGDNGNALGYYVAKTRPVNICVSITPGDKITRAWLDMDNNGSKSLTGSHVVGAPGLDGVYYSPGSCNSVYFFEAETDSYVELGNDLKYFVSDQPLDLNAEKIGVSISTQPASTEGN